MNWHVLAGGPLSQPMNDGRSLRPHTVFIPPPPSAGASRIWQGRNSGGSRRCRRSPGHVGWAWQEARGTYRPGRMPSDRKSVVEGKSVSVRVDRGGRRNLKKKKTRNKQVEKQKDQ